MKKSILSILALIFTGLCYAQGFSVNDNLVWTPLNQTTAQASPFVDFCEGPISYTLSTTNQNGFRRHSTGSGAVFPAFPGNVGSTTIPIILNFPQSVNNLRIHLVDLDFNSSAAINNPEEFINQIQVNSIPTNPNNVVSTAGNVQLVGNIVQPMAGENSSAWIEFNGPVDLLEFTYNRPGNGYGLVIDSVEFDCGVSACECPATLNYEQLGNVPSNGNTSGVLSINSAGDLISSLTIELPYYKVFTLLDCRKCDNEAIDEFGAFTSIPTIAGVTGVPYDPIGTATAWRKITYNFPSPVALNEFVSLNLRFPPSLDLSCCKNSVGYCFNVTLRKDDCTSCEYDVCSKGVDAKEKMVQKSSATSTTLIDGPISENIEIDQLQLNVSPNPTSSTIFGTIGSTDFETGEAFVYTIEGEIVISKTITSRSLKFEISNPGTYLLKVISNGKQSIKKVVVL